MILEFWFLAVESGDIHRYIPARNGPNTCNINGFFVDKEYLLYILTSYCAIVSQKSVCMRGPGRLLRGGFELYV